MEITKKNASVIINSCYKHLKFEAKKKGKVVTDAVIGEYSDTVFEKSETLKEVISEYFFSLQNRQMVSNVIKYTELDRSFLLNLNCHRILEKYGNSVTKLLKCAKECNPRVKRNGILWKVFAGGILDGSRYFLQFKNLENFEKYLKPFTELKTEGALILSQSIGNGYLRGMGKTLAMDFLKNSGTSISPFCVKPDVQIVEIFTLLGLIMKRYPQMRREREAVRIVARISDLTKYSCYEVDKTIWLAGSGNFYLHEENIGRLWVERVSPKNRKSLVKLILSKIGTK